MTRTLKKLLVCFLASSLLFLGFAQSVQAALIGTGEVAAAAVAAAAAHQDRAKLLAELARPDLQARLESLGISRSDAESRIAALTDEEAAVLAERMDSAPAGGDVLGAILLVFFVLLVTDIMGFTKVFPFTRPMR